MPYFTPAGTTELVEVASLKVFCDAIRYIASFINLKRILTINTSCDNSGIEHPV
ncbi:MAG: hypothetical protein ACJATN_001526 [Neolewinella sp.]|jgi:hypothetical protein